jgi:hypothetical protein
MAATKAISWKRASAAFPAPGGGLRNLERKNSFRRARVVWDSETILLSTSRGFLSGP